MVQIERVDPSVRFRMLRLPGQARNPLEEFVAFPDAGLPPDSLRIPMLELEQADLVDRHAHPFYKGAAGELFLARRDGAVVGRIGAIVNHEHNKFEGSKTGFFGFFDCIPEQEIADALLDAAAEWLRAQGMDEIVGPASPSHNYYYGSRDTREEETPTTHSRFLEAYNPAYYNDLYEGWGLRIARRLFGYDVDLNSDVVERTSTKYERTVEEVIRGTGMTFRRLNLGKFDAEIAVANELINRSLQENWGFSPMTREELAYMGSQMRFLIDPDLVLFVELEGKPVGISLAMPDYNQVFAAMNGQLRGAPAAFTFGNLPLVREIWPGGNAWATRKIDVARVIALGVLPTVWRGVSSVRREMLRLGPALVYRTFDNVRQAGYRWLTASWILEDNRAMRAPFQLAGIEPKRVWKIYRKEL